MATELSTIILPKAFFIGARTQEGETFATTMIMIYMYAVYIF